MRLLALAQTGAGARRILGQNIADPEALRYPAAPPESRPLWRERR